MITHVIYLGKASFLFIYLFNRKWLLNLTYTKQPRHDPELQSLPMQKVIEQGQVWSHVFKIYENLDSSLKHCQ